MMNKVCHFLFILVFVTGCATSPSLRKESGQATDEKKYKEGQKEVVDSIEKVTGALSGQDIRREDLENLSRQIKKDEDTRSAVQKVTGAVSGQEIKVKYCPLDGKRYSADLEFCPGTGVKLIPVE